MPGNLTCDQCKKHIGDYSNAYFSDRERDLDFCSEKCYSEWNEKIALWKDIHPDFAKDSGWIITSTQQKLTWQQWWESKKFTVEEIKQLIDTGLQPNEDCFGLWLKDKKQSNSLPTLNADELRTEYNKLWTDIHPDFAKKDYSTKYPYKIYQQLWEERGFTYQDAKEWIAAGFKPKDYDETIKWKDLSFTSSQIQSLIEHGFQLDDYLLIPTYAYGKGLQPTDLNQPTIQADYFNWKTNLTLQEYLNSQYPTPQEKNQVKKIEISKYFSSTIPQEQSKKLIGNQLNLSEYPNLEKVYISGWYSLKSKLTELNLSGCAKLVYLKCSDNQLTNLNLNNCINLKELVCSYNKLPNLNFLDSLNSERLTALSMSNNNITSDLNPFRKLVNLEWLYLGNNFFYGSLEPLKGMVKLKRLDISNTDIDSGLEHLSESVEIFDFSAYSRKDAKCKNVCNLATNEHWISNNKTNIKSIREQQLKKISENKLSNWIPYKQFANIQHLADGGFGKVYKADWTW